MSTRDEKWLAAMRALPAFPRILFQLYSFYDVGPHAMAEGLSANRNSIMLCLAEARSMIRAYCAFRTPERLAPDGITLLEQRVRQHYREWLETTLAESGYVGAIPWPDPSATIEADQEAVAALILSALPETLQRAVERSRKDGVATIDLWRHVLPWRRILRRRLGRVQREITYSGSLPFDEWVANRIAPDRVYPHGYPTVSVRRRPLAEEKPIPAERRSDDAPLSKVQRQMQQRFEGLPPLTQDAYLLFNRHGRTDEEIAGRLSIGRRDVRRRINRALYVICDWPRPSLAFRLSFEIKWRWKRVQRRLCGVRAALRD